MKHGNNRKTNTPMCAMARSVLHIGWTARLQDGIVDASLHVNQGLIVAPQETCTTIAASFALGAETSTKVSSQKWLCKHSLLLCFLSCSLKTRPLCCNDLFDAMDDLAPQSTYALPSA